MTDATAYTTVATYLHGLFRPLNGPDDRAHAQGNTVLANSAREDFLASSTLPEAVNRFLLQLDAKLDAVMALLSAPSLERDFPHAMEIFSLSAAGLEFTTRTPLAPGDWLELVIQINQSGVATAAGIGQVKARRLEGGKPLFSLAFTRIAEDERDKIISHVFREERRLLRETRLES